MAPAFEPVTVRVTDWHPVSAKASSEARSNWRPMPHSRAPGSTQSCVICPEVGATELAKHTPHKRPLFPSTATYEQRAEKRPHPGNLTMLVKKRRAPGMLRYWSFI